MSLSSQHWPPRLWNGERVIWQGRPARAFSFSQQDLIEGFSLLVGVGILLVVALIWLRDRDSADFETGPYLTVAIFLSIGIAYELVGKFPLRAWRRHRSDYIVTNHRAIIATRPFGPRYVREFRLTPDIVMQSDGDLDTIWLGPRKWYIRVGSVKGRPPPQAGFENLENGAAVLDLILKARRNAA